MNLHEYLSKQLQPGEELARVVRRHPVVLVPPLVGGGLLLLADFFLMAWWFGHGWWGVSLWALWLVLSFWWIFRAIYIWSQNVLVLTTMRVIDMNQRGVFDRRVAEAPYDKVQDVRYTLRGIWQTIFHFGSIELQTAGNATNLELTNVREPVELQQVITDLMRRASTTPNPGDLSATELLTIVERLKTELGPAGLNQLLNTGRQPIIDTSGSVGSGRKKVGDSIARTPPKK